MPKATQILGMNARQRLYTGLNSSKAKSYCSSKYATKSLLINQDIPTAEVYGVFATTEDVNTYDWDSIEQGVIIKPTNGNAGKGVIGLTKKLPNGEGWLDLLGNKITLQEVKVHCYDILEGQYSTYGSDHMVILEELIVPHPTLAKYSYKGTADVRVVVYNRIPVMALLRLPTKESEGRANQSQGAIGVGIDLATGITTHATQHLDDFIKYLPGTKKKLNGIKIPFWKNTLLTAVRASEAAGLYYAGVDLFLHQDRGPLVVELNSNPGLSIQVANRAGLRTRLERVQGLNVNSPQHGVKIAQALFATHFFDKQISEEDMTLITTSEKVKVKGDTNSYTTTHARINTGRFRTAISSTLAQTLGLLDLDDLLWYQESAHEGQLPVVELTIHLKNQIITTSAVISKRLDHTNYDLDIGRKDLHGFIINPAQ